MPHQCVRCGKLYPDGSQELLKGCSCGGRFFFFIKKEHLEETQKITRELSPEEKIQIEEDILEIVGIKDEEYPVVLDLENIKILEPGKYQIDVVELFKGKPLVYRLEEGKYIIDVAASFKKSENK